MKNLRMLLLAGGASDEHEVSIISARSLLEALRQSPIEVVPLVISRQGMWLSKQESQNALKQGKADSGGSWVGLRPDALAWAVSTTDVVFPLLHGPFGEDGTVQGLLELMGLPYIGSNVLASALCMDKPMAKDVLAMHHIPQVRYVTVINEAWKSTPDQILAACRDIADVWFVKPANLGSSVGISRVTEFEQLRKALDSAFQFDRRVIVEQGLPNVRELEVAVLGNEQPKASVVGEITYASSFYDYETKYSEGKADLHIPANIPENLAAELKTLATKAFQLLDCAGFARVDFLLDTNSQNAFLNEVNTIPGFTPFSMFTKLWEASGMPYVDLVIKLAELAMQRFAQRPQSKI